VTAESRRATIRCSQVGDEARPSVPVVRSHCAKCGKAVWLEDGLVADVHRDMSPECEIEIVCTRCPLDEIEKRNVTRTLPGQVDRLIRSGVPVGEIAEGIALVATAGPTATPDDVKAMKRRILDDPKGLEAIAYRMHLGTARRYVMGVMRRN
jgi:hypothetical protein